MDWVLQTTLVEHVLKNTRLDMNHDPWLYDMVIAKQENTVEGLVVS